MLKKKQRTTIYLLFSLQPILLLNEVNNSHLSIPLSLTMYQLPRD
jgi:hypothetical protein